MDILAERIRAARLARGMSQAELAEKAGYTSRAAINKIELGKMDPPRSKVLAIAEALHVSPAWLLGMDEPEDKAAMLQRIYDKCHILFDSAEDATPEELARAAQYIEFMKTQR